MRPLHHVSKVLAGTEFATAKMNMPYFELQNIFIELGEDIKAGLICFGSSTFGFVGYVKFVKKPKAELTNATIAADSVDEDYSVVHESSDTKSLSKFVVIPRKEIIKDIQRSLSFVTVLGYTIPGIANFVARPNIDFFWK